MVPTRIDAERSPISTRTESDEGPALAEQTLDIRFDDLHAVAVWVSRAERIRAPVGLASCGPRGFCEDTQAEWRVSKGPHLRGERARLVAREAAGEVRFDTDRLAKGPAGGTAHRQGDDQNRSRS